MTFLIAGAGPAGARLATALSEAGKDVVLVDRLTNPHRNSFSSAALSCAEASRLNLPQSAWSATWSGWQLLDPSGHEHQWWDADPLGVVLDFGRLRSAMWSRARAAGAEVVSGCTVRIEALHSDGAHVLLQHGDGRRQHRSVKWVIDATGASRCLLREASVPPPSTLDPLLEGVGVEWLIQADDRVASRWLDRISFFLGTRWIPHGYGWVFPMENNRLKVGVCCLAPVQIKGSRSDLLARLQALLRNCKLEGCSVLDRHGGVVSSSIARRESLGSGALLAVGDAASTANLLGGEGIRHAIDSADLLAETLLNAEGLNQVGLNQVGADHADVVRQTYEKALHQWFGWRWRAAGKLAQRTWWGLDSSSADRRVERIINGLSRTSSARDLSNLLFHYRFERYGLRLLRYLI